MANVKISQLPAASSVIPAVDVLPIVHSGVTQKVTSSQIVQSVLPSPGPIGATTPSTAAFSALTVTGASGLQKAVAGLFTNAIAGTDYLPATTGSAIQKANGVGGLTNAVSGTDYAPPTVGTSILYGNGSGGFSNVTVGSGLQFTAGTLSSTATGGTVTSVSGTGTVNGLTLTGTVTTSGSLTLGGTLNLSTPPAIGGTTPAAITGTTVTANTKFVSSYFDASGSGGGALRTASGTACLQWGGGGGTNLTLDGAFNMNPANASISIAPTGTGTLTVNPATAGTIDNVAIGGTTAAAGKFTSLTATGTTTLATSLNGLLKSTSGVVSAATSGTDYAPATSGTSILYGDGSGGFSNVTVGSGLSFTGGTLASTSGGGSVTTVSVVSANGFAGTVANPSSTPAITLSTSVTGLLKGNGTAISAATSGTDYAPATSGSSILYGNGSGGFSNVTIGTNLTFVGGTLNATGGGTSVTISNDTSTATNLYPLFASATSGTASTVYTGNANYLYKPSTGELQAQEVIAANGIFVNSQTVAASYSIASGSNAMSAGPVTVASGQTVTVSSGSVWTVV